MNQKVIYDIIHGNIEVSGFESILLKSPIVNRLHQILQNSTAYTVFPNLKASRFEHSLGTMKNAGNMYDYGLVNSDISKEFLKNKKELIYELIMDNNDRIFNRLSVKDDVDTPYSKHLQDNLGLESDWSNLNKVISSKKFTEKLLSFLGKKFCDRNISSHSNVNILLFQSVRLFGMLHDIGHLPLSHLFEHSIDGVYEQLKDIPEKNRNDFQKDYFGKLDEFLKVPDTEYSTDKEKIHERIGKNTIRYIFQEAQLKVYEHQKIEHPERAINIFIIFIIELIWSEMIKGKKGKLNCIYSIVSNTIDADRLDFVQRDGMLSGIAKAMGNFNRIIEMFCLGKRIEDDSSDDRYSFMPSIQSLSDVEELLHQRFRIYQYMVNHHAVARSNYIFQKVIQYQILNEIEKGESDFSKGTSNLKIEKLSSVIDIAIELSTQKESIGSHKKTVRKFIQLTDFWLHSILNKEFIKTCAVEEEKLTPQDKRLKEIYENKKNFRSLWKGSHQYHDFLLDLGVKIVQNVEAKLLEETEIFKKIKSNHLALKNVFDEYEKLNNRIVEIERELDAKQTTEEKQAELRKDLKKLKSEQLRINLLFINFGGKIISFTKSYTDEINWVKIFEENLLNEKLNVLIKPSELNTGIGEFYLIDKKNQKIIHKFNRFSSKDKSLQMELENEIGFFVFYDDNDIINAEGLKKLKEKLISLLIENFKTILTLKQ